MKKLLLIVGIVLIIACIIALLLAFINMQSYKSLRDGSPSHYDRLHQRMIVYFIIGIVLAVIGIACILLRFKM